MRDSDGSKIFKLHKFINKDQIKSLFSRMSQQQRAGKLKEPDKNNYSVVIYLLKLLNQISQMKLKGA